MIWARACSAPSGMRLGWTQSISRCAIKQKQCKRAMSIEGRLTWRFNDMAAYYQAVDTLQLEQGVHTECMFVRDSRASPVETQGAPPPST